MAKKIEDEADNTASVDLTEERLAKLRQRAHELYEARGREEGHDLEDWLQAEAEVEELKMNAAKE